MKKTFIFYLLFISINHSAQDSFYIPSENKLILDHKKGVTIVSLKYFNSKTLFSTNFHYPSINISYNISNNFGLFIGGTITKNNSTKYYLLGANEKLLNNNYSYEFGFSFFRKVNFLKFNRYEFVAGLDNKKMSISKINENLSFEVKNIEEKYFDYYIQSNFIRTHKKSHIVLGIKLSIINHTELINIKNNLTLNDYINDNNNSVNKPLYINTSISYFTSINKKENLFFNIYAGIGFSKGDLIIRNGGGTFSNSLIDFTLGLGLSYVLK